MIPKLRNISYEMCLTFVSVKEKRRTRGHGNTFAKKQYRLD